MTILSIQDPIWAEFAPLWADISVLEPPIVLSGGYGLFLKQQFMQAHPEVPTVVALADWPDMAPRSTRDMDFLLEVALIGSPDAQREVRRVLNSRGYTIIDPNWQFEKTLSDDMTVHVDLLAPPSQPGMIGVSTDLWRVKSVPSLGEDGIHGHTLAEASGFELHPYRFAWKDVSLRVPHPVPWCVMKLAATRDRWQKSQNVDCEEDLRAWQREQALKHAGDVCRVLALTTREERTNASQLVDKLRGEAPFQDAARIAQEFFVQSDAIMLREPSIINAWSKEDFERLRELLNSWLPTN